MSLLMRDLGVLFLGGGWGVAIRLSSIPPVSSSKLLDVAMPILEDNFPETQHSTYIVSRSEVVKMAWEVLGDINGMHPAARYASSLFLSHPLAPVPEKRCFSALGSSSWEPSLCHPTPHRRASLKVARERYTRHHTYINTHDTAHDARTQRHVRFEWCSSTVLTLADLPPPTDCCLFCTRSIVPNKNRRPFWQGDILLHGPGHGG